MVMVWDGLLLYVLQDAINVNLEEQMHYERILCGTWNITPGIRAAYAASRIVFLKEVSLLPLLSPADRGR